MPFVELEGRRIEAREGDTVASALWRAGVRIFARSFKYRRPRGLYCLTGDCPSCLCTVDGEPGVRACCTPVHDGQRISRDIGWPSAETDALSFIGWFRRRLPVGSYYKTFTRPQVIWSLAERVIRRFTGFGRVTVTLKPEHRRTMHHHPDLLVIGGGVAGLAAALAAVEAGQSVVVLEEFDFGGLIAPGPLRDRIQSLVGSLRSNAQATLIERAAAAGIYEGPLVPAAGPDFLHQVHPGRIVIATGAVERHAVFPGSDLPGVWLGRGAARMAGVHRNPIGKEVVVAAETAEGLDHLRTLIAHGVAVKALAVPEALAGAVPAGPRVITGGKVVAARGRKTITSAVIESAAGREAIPCNALVLSLGLEPRDSVLRQSLARGTVAAGEVARPGLSVAEAEESGRRAARGTGETIASVALPPRCAAGIACLCEDTSVKEWEEAWSEGYNSTQILKRYTKTTTGPCQGSMCHPHLRAFAAEKGGMGWISGPTTARPPVRPIRIEDAAAGLYHLTEQRTALHDRHLAAGAKMEIVGPWARPQTYGDTTAEYWAVRRDVSVMDVSTLGKYYVTGRDATEFLERLYPCHVRDIAEGRMRYALLLNEAGYVIDDGLIASLGSAGYFLTFTSSGADGIESWLRDWIETWGLNVHIVAQTAAVGAINLAGPKARELLQRLTPDPVDNASLGYSRHREITVAGVKCRAFRVGFVGELSVELHHPRSQSVKLWDALLTTGADLGIKPHAMDALRLLRLEKGHILVGQDTDFDTTPGKLALDWAVKMDKPWFVGKTALERIAATTMEQKLISILFDPGAAPMEGATLDANGEHVGYLTSSRYSPVLERGVGLGWVRRVGGQFPTAVSSQGISGKVVHGPFYDPKGEKLRA